MSAKKNVPDFHWDGQVTLLSSLSSAPGHIFFSDAFLLPCNILLCSLAEELMGNGITESTGPFSFLSPVLTSSSPLLFFEERLFLGVRGPCMAFGLLPPSQTWELH